MSTKTIKLNRHTTEVNIELSLNVDGSGNTDISTGIGFFDHMLTALAFWARWDLTIKCTGDLDVDTHHSVEDTAIVLGQAIRESWTNRERLTRFGDAWVPMDEALSQVVLDLSNRPYLVFDANLQQERVGTFETIMAKHFFSTLAIEGRMTLHIRNIYGENAHHILESIFKATGIALRQSLSDGAAAMPSTKGAL